MQERHHAEGAPEWESARLHSSLSGLDGWEDVGDGRRTESDDLGSQRAGGEGERRRQGGGGELQWVQSGGGWGWQEGGGDSFESDSAAEGVKDARGSAVGGVMGEGGAAGGKEKKASRMHFSPEGSGVG